ncbi:MAG: hypothetical protein H7281_14680 [Bacteriovorax sp.]|nr:hypothetical protein [Bacteriovorax sp.]
MKSDFSHHGIGLKRGEFPSINYMHSIKDRFSELGFDTRDYLVHLPD